MKTGILFVIASTTLCVTSTLAVGAEVQQVVTGALEKPAGKQNIPILKYKSTVSPNGSIQVHLDGGEDKADDKKSNIMAVFAPNVLATERLLHSQDWYMTIGPNGGTRGIYTVPRNASLPSTVLRGLGEGHGIMKVNPRGTFFKVFPSKHQLASQLTTFTEAARKSVCDQAVKPKTLSADMDVKPGWSGSGRITFNATWEVSELCKKPKS